MGSKFQINKWGFFHMWRIMPLCVNNSIFDQLIWQALSDIELKCMTLGEGGTRFHDLYLVILGNHLQVCEWMHRGYQDNHQTTAKMQRLDLSHYFAKNMG